jgi:hypothetical protein
MGSNDERRSANIPEETQVAEVPRRERWHQQILSMPRGGAPRREAATCVASPFFVSPLGERSMPAGRRTTAAESDHAELDAVRELMAALLHG